MPRPPPPGKHMTGLLFIQSTASHSDKSLNDRPGECSTCTYKKIFYLMLKEREKHFQKNHYPHVLSL